MRQDELDRLTRAVAIVQRDADATGIPARIQLELAGRDGGRDAYHVALSDGQFWAAREGLAGDDDVIAIREVAEGTQDLFAELLRVAWPLCPVHERVLEALPSHGPERPRDHM